MGNVKIKICLMIQNMSSFVQVLGKIVVKINEMKPMLKLTYLAQSV